MPSQTPTLNQRIAQQATSAVAWVRDVSMFVKLVLVAGGAFVSGMAKVLPLPTAPIDVKDMVEGGGLAAVFIGGVALAFMDKNLAGSLKVAADAAAELQGLQATAASLGENLARADARDAQLRALRSAATAMRDGVERSLQRRPPDEVATMTEILDLGLDQLQIALGLVVGDIWTISIYRAEPGLKPVLRRVASRRSNRIEEGQPSREWRPGEGHIGMTYLRADETILEDVADPAIRHFTNTPAEKDLPSDAFRYRSIAAIPVIQEGADEVWGVVIATSSRAGQFSPVAHSDGFERAQTMRIFAGLVALAASIHHILTVRPRAGGGPTLSV